ncbi:MAG: hypothetical protein FJ139_11095, partial [Deltaproteobacteria bacterium]|nr:hypothetical protein [Deltaproteobacteria bacterium]
MGINLIKIRIISEIRAILLIISVCLLTSCATAIPEIYLNKGDLTMELHKETFAIEGMDVSRDGKYLLTSDNGGSFQGESSIRLWDLTEWKQIYKTKGEDTIWSIAISPDNKYIVTGSLIPKRGWLDPPVNGEFIPLKVREMASGRLYRQNAWFKDFSGDGIVSVKFSFNKKYFLACDRTSIYIYDANTFELFKTLTSSEYNPSKVMPYNNVIANFSPDGKYIASGGVDAVIRLWDVKTGRELKQFVGHKATLMYGGICSVEFSPDGKHVLTNAYGDNNAILWDIEKGIEVRRYSDFRGWIGMYFWDQSVSFSPNGRQVFVSLRNIFDVETGKTVVDLSESWKGVVMGGRTASPSIFHPSGNYVLMVPDSAVRIFDTRYGKEQGMLLGFEDGEWLVITAEGYYNTSEKGAQYLSVKVGAALYSVDQFYDVFYRPDIVAAKLRGEDISGLVTITMQDAIKSPPPTVEFTSTPSSTNEAKAKICYRVKSAGGGIGEVRLFHNGKLIQSDGFYKEITRSASDRTQLASLNSNAIYADMRSVSVKSI